MNLNRMIIPELEQKRRLNSIRKYFENNKLVKLSSILNTAYKLL